jgi:hypothetical protein
MKRFPIACAGALRRSRILDRLRQLFPRRKRKTTGHGGFCYKPNGDLLYIPPGKRGTDRTDQSR